MAVLVRSSSALVLGVGVPRPTWPFSKVAPVPLGVRVTFWLVPPAVKVSAPLPVMEPVVVPVPPLPRGRVPVVSLARLRLAPLPAAVMRPWASTVRLARE